ncbi:hypothetical protein N302_07505, partial [Corvus brachyrhynchos]
DQVQDHPRNLKVHKSMGHDEMHLQVLWEWAAEIAKPLSSTVEKSSQSHEGPTNWKSGNKTPIFKKGNKEDRGNYRPANLTCPGNIMEKIILGGIERHLKNNAII